MELGYNRGTGEARSLDDLTAPALAAQPMEHDTPMTGMPDYRLSHIQALEAESIHIFREVAAELSGPPSCFPAGRTRS